MLILDQNRQFFLFRVTLKVDGWPWKIKGHLFYIISKPSENSKWCHSPETLNLGKKLAVFCPVWPWNLTDDLEKDNRAPILCCFKLCASFHSHPWIQTRVAWHQTSLKLNQTLIKSQNFLWEICILNCCVQNGLLNCYLGLNVGSISPYLH